MGETEKDFCQNLLQLFLKNIDRRNILLVFLAFSKALDRIRREEILQAASSKGLPIPFAHWLRDFLLHSTARVQINGERLGTTKTRFSTMCGTVSANVPPIH